MIMIIISLQYKIYDNNKSSFSFSAPFQFLFNPLSVNNEYAHHKNTFLHVRKQNHWTKLKS